MLHVCMYMNMAKDIYIQLNVLPPLDFFEQLLKKCVW